MNQELKASYYFGIKPQAIKATARMELDRIHIEYIIEEKEEDRVWEVSKIKPDQNATDDKFILKYGVSHPYEFLEFDDPNAYQQLCDFYPNKKWKQTGNAFTKNPLLTAVSILGIFIVLSIFIYFMVAPKCADLLAKGISEKWETELGEKISKGILAEKKEDKIKSSMLDTFFVMMDVQSKYPIQFHFVNDSIINAFAIPGGNIVIYKGLFDKIESYESLAGLISHEFTHIENKHSLKTIFRSVSSFIILAALFGDLTGLAGILLQNANSLQNLSFSREFEREADVNAVDILLDRKIGLTGMLDLFNVFLKDEHKGLEVPGFLSTHPVTEDRIAYVKSKMGRKESDLVQYQNLLNLFNRLKQR